LKVQKLICQNTDLSKWKSNSMFSTVQWYKLVVQQKILSVRMCVTVCLSTNTYTCTSMSMCVCMKTRKDVKIKL
jgi:hypothetical protein